MIYFASLLTHDYCAMGLVAILESHSKSDAPKEKD
jgi:hypothetical protein